MSNTTKSLYLIDGHAQIYRGYYGPFGNLTAPSGEPTKATYTFMQTLLSLIKNKKPDYLAMVLDSGEAEVFRMQISADYKAHRAPMPEDLPQQIKRIVQILTEAGIPILVLPGFEADDIIATFAEKLRDSDVNVYMVSKDKDLDQLLSDKVRMYDPGKDVVIGPDDLLAQKGYTPDKAVEVQALAGDAVDNIEGIPGVGPKTAAKLVMKYGSAEEAIRHADEQTPKLRQNLTEYGDRVKISRQLVTLRRDVPIEVDLNKLIFKGIQRQHVEPIFRELGFDRLLRQIENGAIPEAPPATSAPRRSPRACLTNSRQRSQQKGSPAQDTKTAEGSVVVPAGDLFSRIEVTRSPRDYTLVDDEEKFKTFLESLRQVREFSFDTETTSISPIEAELGRHELQLAGRARILHSSESCRLPGPAAEDRSGASPADPGRHPDSQGRPES